MANEAEPTIWATVWPWVATVVGVLGVGAVFRSYIAGVVKHLLPSERRVADSIRQRDLPLPEGERFVVLIADLEGDDEQRSHTRHVARALEPYQGLEVVRIGPGPEWGIESRDDFEAKARSLLAERQGDVLISGDVAAAAKGLRLRFLPADSSVRTQPEAREGRRPGENALTETGLPLDFDEDLNGVLLALVAATVAPATEKKWCQKKWCQEPFRERVGLRGAAVDCHGPLV